MVTKIVRIPVKGDHVTIGKAVTIWRADYVQTYAPEVNAKDWVMVDRVSYATGTARYVRRRFRLEQVKIIGRHTERADARETPQNCRECGTYREVTR